MIAIERGPEPDALRQTRHWRLAAQLLARHQGFVPPKDRIVKNGKLNSTKAGYGSV